MPIIGRLGLCALTLLATARPARALILECGFTEPFFHTFYDPTQGLIVLAYDFNDDPIHHPNQQWHVLRHTISPRIFELRTSRHQLIEHVSHDWQGNDGMSDLSQPYSVRLFRSARPQSEPEESGCTWREGSLEARMWGFTNEAAGQRSARQDCLALPASKRPNCPVHPPRASARPLQ